MLYYVNLFYFYSFLGFLLELFVKSFIFKGMNSGILYGPWLPIYGFGSILVILMERFIFQYRKVPRVIRIILVFLSLAFSLSIIEYLGGMLIEFVFHKTFWNYSEMRFNIGKYASLEMALVWGLGSLLIIYIINPLSEKFIKKIPVFITILVSIFFLLDFVLTFFFR